MAFVQEQQREIHANLMVDHFHIERFHFGAAPPS